MGHVGSPAARGSSCQCRCCHGCSDAWSLKGGCDCTRQASCASSAICRGLQTRIPLPPISHPCANRLGLLYICTACRHTIAGLAHRSPQPQPPSTEGRPASPLSDLSPLQLTLITTKKHRRGCHPSAKQNNIRIYAVWLTEFADG